MVQSHFSIWRERVLLLWINLSVTIRNIFEFGQVVFRYYSNVRFAKIDLSLLYSYLWTNPFRINKRFLIQKGEKEVYTYGETPLTTLEKIARSCGIKPRDVVFELGCGRGRACFWLSQFIGCRVVGIDHVPLFIEKATDIQKRFGLENVTFRLEDLFQANLKGATVIYLYGTCYSAAFIELLIARLSQCPAGTKVITTTYALTEFQPQAPFKVIKRFPSQFTWGETDIYCQVKTR